MKVIPPSVRFFFFRIFPWPFIIAGAILLGFGLLGVIRARASTEWPTARGEIVSASVERHQRSGTGAGRSGGTTYHAEVLYDFSIEGTKYSGTRVAFGDYGASDAAHARNIVNRYPKGERVSVHYMPDNPEVCVLEPGTKVQTWLLAGIGLIFFCVGSGMALLLAKISRATEQPVAADGTDGATAEPQRAPK